ncbi:dimethylmenaquinone methyltransferase [Streptomyces viridochromogenes]|uniref:Dimethylmenaquinone methyltransferase n=1 Tax=Streptomyces viridochromogenes TaxID=1938 RepID=A0A0J8CA52_STRVR|nr:FAD-binding and (Fe-S)-binding domain-containing protein [Streptomyces viridochromogenes]KMS74745.1 dimethylmenaquinone methyltransferase [Streptomyces viridochromogenes]KOG14804.1 dimethylmenaquinone methyltransferase [Streptomyces viridochromogenes]KOG14998.1 dimethylmenaquinone methyltransferase [Streptomyces viridochromogenes]
MRDLEAALRAVVRGEVGFDVTSRALVTMDASNYRRVPLGVVAPHDAEDVAAVLEVCRDHMVPVVARGGGTSIAGQATGTGVVLDFTRHMNRIVSLDPETRTAVVEPGVVLDRLQGAAAPHGLRFGPDPSTHSRCTLGGMIGNNSCGSHSVAWGTTADSVRELDVLTARGARLRLGQGWAGAPEGLRELVEGHLARLRTGFPELPRRISGYALDALLTEKGADVARSFCGSEGTLGILTEAVVRLVEAPRARALAVLAYADESAAAEAAAGLLPYGPLTVEGMAADLVPSPNSLPAGGAWLFVETGGESQGEARARAEAIVRAADVVGALVVTDPAGQRALWRIREDASGTATRMPDGSEAWPGWEDCAVPPPRLGAYLRDFRALLTAHGLRGTPYGHFGDGCIHVRIDFDLLTEAGIGRFRRFSEELAEVVVAHGGSLSGEHGDGQARAELLPRMYGEEMVGLFERAKGVWDPDDLLNPGMLVRPAPLDSNLRFSVLPREPVDVAFGYQADGGDFAAAVRRCVGVAKCRTTSATGPAVMCPSFRATGDEEHSTRGRARLLHEMLAGELVTDGWRSTEVRDALDLCLACKGCRSDCPVEVDMATYKAEFLHHHYEGRRRPAAHHSMGRLPEWLRLVARTRTASLANALAAVPPLAWAAKRLGGIAPERDIPRLATRTFSRWWERREKPPAGPRGDLVILWPDTFTEHLSPSVGQAAVRVLEAAGLRVALPPTVRMKTPSGDEGAGAKGGAGEGVVVAMDPVSLLRGRERVCCGLTYVSTGQLDRARAVLRRTLDLMEPVLETAAPVVVLEPSCAAALRSDLPELLHDDPRARRLADRVLTFAETLERLAPDWTPPRVDRPAVGQTHCHQHAVLGDKADRRLREAAGLNGELSGGCCGLAGNFGFEKGHFEVSVACAEERLLPGVRAAGEGAVVLADGFSCRTQLEQLAGVRGRHLAEVLADGLAQGLADGLEGHRSGEA